MNNILIDIVEYKNNQYFCVSGSFLEITKNSRLITSLGRLNANENDKYFYIPFFFLLSFSLHTHPYTKLIYIMVNAVCGQGYDSCSTRIGAVEFGFAVSFPLLFPLFMFFCLHRKSIFGEEFLTNVANRSRSSYNAAQSALQGSHNFRRRQSHAPAGKLNSHTTLT